MALSIKPLEKTEDKITLIIEDVDVSVLNAIRRSIMDEIPTMTIEDVTFIKNTSALYDEIIANRLGLIPLSTDLKGYNLQEKCKCQGKGCARCQLKFVLQAKGPCIVYAENLKSKDPKIKPVYPTMPIVQLLKGQQLQIEAVARLGIGREHAKFSPGLAYYRAYPILKVNKDSNIKACLEKISNLTQKGSNLEINNVLEWNEASEQICEDNKIEVGLSKDKFIFTIESWGQIDVKRLPVLGVDYFNEKLKELTKLLK